MCRGEKGGWWKESDDGEGDARERARSKSKGDVELGNTNQGQSVRRNKKVGESSGTKRR
jgi:hypothetical protein